MDISKNIDGLKSKINLKSINFKFAFFIWLVIIFVLGLYIWSIIPFQKKIIIDRMETEARGIATSISQVTFNAIILEDYSFIVDHCLNVIEDSKSLEYIVITKNDGFSLIHTINTWSIDTLAGDWVPDSRLRKKAYITFSELKNHECFHYSHFFSYSGIDWGWIHIGLSTDPINAAVKHLYKRSLILFIIFSIYGLLISIAFTRSLIHPIHTLNKVTNQYTSGKKDVRVDIHTGDEFENLADSFNYMIDNINKIHNELELRVAERTRELAKSNAQLTNEIDVRKQIESRQQDLLIKLKSANEDLRSFAYIVSHDLKAPLRAIGSLVQWIALDYRSLFDEDGKEQLDLLVNRTERMHRFIEGILQYTKVGRIKEEKQKVDMNQMIDNLADLLEIPKNISIQKKTRLPVVEYEKIYIEQVFQNLVGNAIKYMDKDQGIISINCRKNNGFWKFSITDNGPGIESKYHEKIFQIFQTLKPRDEIESTGIGLTIVKRIIENSGGKIWVKSALGKGSTFAFTIPRKTKDSINKPSIVKT
ncbi:HAMP domain-containing protein [bacterium]|nr:HAMP domain-containing protein [bacterium]